MLSHAMLLWNIVPIERIHIDMKIFIQRVIMSLAKKKRRIKYDGNGRGKGYSQIEEIWKGMQGRERAKVRERARAKVEAREQELIMICNSTLNSRERPCYIV